jgi:hypothetical protein
MKPGILLLLLVISASVIAQETKNDDFIPQMTNGLGISFQTFNGINDRISKLSQYRRLDNYAATIELGMLTEHKQFVSDMNVMLGSSFSGHSHGGSVIRYFGVNIGWGYDLLKEKNKMLYPLVGLSLQGYQARFYQDNSSVPFDNVVESPPTQNDLHSLDFTTLFFAYRLGLGFSVFSSRHPKFSVGLQGIYTGSFNSQTWKNNQGQSLLNAPEDRLNQYHISLLFGRQIHLMNY